MNADIELLKKCIENRSPILFLGAGFSLDAKGKCGENLMLGDALAKKLIESVIYPHLSVFSEKDLDMIAYADKWGDLRKICDIIRQNGLVDERNSFFKEWMSQCSYDADSCYPYVLNVDWKYIFTLNIDDLVEHIYNNAGKDLLQWKNSSVHFKDAADKTVLVKLHGDVGDHNTYVFDEKEYQDFILQDNWMLRKFSDLYVSHDVIIVGTQFQEDDIEIALKKVFDYGCDNSNFHYFFIAPGKFNGKVNDAIENLPNFHHIEWKTNEFLKFLEDGVARPKDAIQRICSQGITFWNKELTNAQSKRESMNLYYGMPSEPRDFYYKDDIARKKEADRIKEFISANSHGYIEIKGKSYVGKTCLAKRTLTMGVEQMFQSFYCPKTDLQYLQIIREYLEGVNFEEQVILCFEDAAAFYRLLVNLVEEYKNRLKKLIVIVTSSDITKSSDRYVFQKSPFLEILLTEKVDGVLASDIYDKLNEKSQLGTLVNYAENRRDIVKYMKQIDDIIDVLYVAHHGKRFADHFADWIGMRDTDEQFVVFQVVSLLTTIGVANISINYLPDIAASMGCKKFNHPRFMETFGEFCMDANGCLKLRCSRLFNDVILGKLSDKEKITIVKNLVYLVSKDLKEGDKTSDSELFKHLIRASSLTSIVGLEAKKAIVFLLELKEQCKHLSYYWVQLGILYRSVPDYEEAENAFEYAKKVHGRDNYQIAHTTAKNYMEWGTWAIQNVPSQATVLFEEGTERMLKMFWQWKYPDAICFSAHTYIDMNIKYYTALQQVPPESTWALMNKFMEEYIRASNLSDQLLQRIFSQMRDFARKNMLKIDQEKELQQIIGAKETLVTEYPTEWIDEELPAYE